MTSRSPVFYDEVCQTVPEVCMRSLSHWNLRQDIQACHACCLARFVKPLPLNNPEASVMIIGESPEDVLFDTPQGRLLAECLKSCGFDFRDLYLTSLVKCVGSTEYAKCVHHLMAEILLVRPIIAIALGYNPSFAFSDTPEVGQFIQILPSTTVLTTYSFVGANDQTLAFLYQQFSYVQSQLRVVKTA